MVDQHANRTNFPTAISPGTTTWTDDLREHYFQQEIYYLSSKDPRCIDALACGTLPMK